MCVCVQVVRADAALSVAKAQHLRQVQQQAGSREQVEVLQAQLQEETRRSRQLEEAMKLQVQQSSSQMSVKQVGQWQPTCLTTVGQMLMASSVLHSGPV